MTYMFSATTSPLSQQQALKNIVQNNIPIQYLKQK